MDDTERAEIERDAIGALLMDGSRETFLGLGFLDFTVPAWAEAFGQMHALHLAGLPVDITTLARLLAKFHDDKLDVPEWTAVLSEVVDQTRGMTAVARLKAVMAEEACAQLAHRVLQ